MTSMFMPKAPPPADPPKPKPPAPMPDAESPAVMEARRRKQVADLARGGRTSTILTGESDRGYSGTQLGA